MTTLTMFLIIVTLAVINAIVVPALVYLADTLTSFVMRTDRKEWLTTLCEKKYNCTHYYIEDKWGKYDLLGGVLVCFLTFFMFGALDELWGINYISGAWLLLPVGVVALPFVLRFVVDVTRNLKLESGDSKRLRELEAEIRAIKEKQ